MLIRRAEEVTGQPMQMPGVRGVTMRLLVGREDGAPNFSMRHFTVEPGGHTPRHEHNYEHEILVLSGSARVEENGAYHEIKAGDVVFVPRNVVHQFVNEGREPFEFICLVPIEFDCGNGTCQPTPGS